MDQTIPHLLNPQYLHTKIYLTINSFQREIERKIIGYQVSDRVMNSKSIIILY